MSESPGTKFTVPTEHAVQKKDGRREEKREARNHNEGSPSPDFAALMDTIAREGKANRDEEAREDRGKRFREYLTLIFIIATAAGVFYQAHIFSQQLDEMKSASVQTNQLIGANAKLAEAAGKQADAAQKQADALGEAAKVSHESMILAQRAWVGPTNGAFSAEPSIGKPIEIAISYQNSGRQPALNFVYLGDPFSATTAEDANGTVGHMLTLYMEGCRNAKEWQGGSVAYPSTGFSSYNLNTKTKDDFVDEAITKGDKIVFFRGCFLYQSFDAPRHSYFCYFYKQGQTKIQNLNICTTGHYAD